MQTRTRAAEEALLLWQHLSGGLREVRQKDCMEGRSGSGVCILTRSLVVLSRWPWRTTERWPLSSVLWDTILSCFFLCPSHEDTCCLLKGPPPGCSAGVFRGRPVVHPTRLCGSCSKAQLSLGA